VSDKVLVIPATFRVGSELPPNLPVADGGLKPTSECTREDVAAAVEELKSAARASRDRLEVVYAEHVRDVEVLAQVMAYLDRYDQWDSLRHGGQARETLWHIDDRDY
jgi:hypothetical protein